MRLLEAKSKQGEHVLTNPEKDIHKAVVGEVFNIPQPIFAYIKEVGTYTDRMGKETLLEIPPLPVTKVQNCEGYHSEIINAENQKIITYTKKFHR